MRLLKTTLVIALIIMITLSTVFYNRNSLVISVVNTYLNEDDISLTCADFAINKNFDVQIHRLCVDSPYAEITLLDSFITWQFNSAKPKAMASSAEKNTMSDKLVAALSAINIAEINVRLKADITLPINTVPIVAPQKSALELRQVPALVSSTLNDFSLLTSPVDVHIQQINYQPFIREKSQSTHVYQGKLKLDAQQLNFSLVNDEQETILAINMVNKNQGLTANMNGDLAKLRAFALLHKAAVPVAISSLLTDDSWTVSGNITSQATWHNQRLSLTAQLSDFHFISAYQADSQTMLELATDFTWQTSLIGDLLTVNFSDNKQALRLSTVNLAQLLSAQEIEPQLIQLITDNAINSLTIKPLGSLTIDFAKQIINSDGLALTTDDVSEPITLILTDVALSYASEGLVVTIDPQQVNFSLTGAMNVAQLQPYSKKPVKLAMIGDVKQYSDSWQLTLHSDSAVKLAKLSLPSGVVTSSKKISAAIPPMNQQPSIKSLRSAWQGKIVIAKSDNKKNSPQDQTKFAVEKSRQDQLIQEQLSDDKISFDLVIDNQIRQVNYPQIAKINDIALSATVKGSADDLAINTRLIADNVPIATAQVSGDISQPTIAISAEQLALTDILALNIKLPVKVALIDGTLDYHLSGQLKKSRDLADLLTNPLSLTLSVQNLSGDIAGTWLQELNWQQHFTLQNGQLKSITANAKPLSNLSVAKIETVTEINQLAATTVIDISPETTILQLKNTGASLLQGRFDIDLLQWPLTNAQPINVKLTTIDLEKLLELDKSQGIVVTGKVSGDLPIFYDGEHALIKAGYLHNVGDGLIQVYNNAAIDELKASGLEVKLAFDALENLHYHQLSSEVSMANDGYMLLNTVIKGRNPDLDNEVNLNLNLSYDLIGLLESLNITEHFESNLQQNAQN